MNTRLLLAAAGAGSFPAPPLTRTVTAAPDGNWTQASEPHAVYHAGYVYVAYQNGSSGALKVSVFDVLTDTVTTAATLRTFTPDSHTAPSLIVRSSDHKLVLAYSDHVGPQMYVRISTNSLDSDPTISGGWASEITLDATLGGSFYTYPSLFETDRLWLFYRDHQDSGNTAVLAYSTSTDGGATWTAQTELFKNSMKSSYWVIGSDGSRIDVATNDGHPVSEQGSVYHFFYDGSWRTSVGVALTLPVTPATATLIYDDATDGNAWATSISGTTITYEVLDDPADNSYRYAVWDGAAWDSFTITNANGVIESGVAAHCALDRVEPRRVWISKKVGSHWEIQRWETTDGGASWTSSALTSGSSVDNILPANIRNHPSIVRVVWLAGTYTTYLSTSLGVMLGR